MLLFYNLVPYKDIDDPSKMIAFNMKKWVNFEEMIKWINEANAIDFTVRSSRHSVMTKWDAMQTKPVTTASTQVPTSFNKICLLDSDWPSKESTLRAILATRPTGKSSSPNTSQSETLSSDPILAYYKLLEAMLVDLSNGCGLYNQGKFDERFGWA